MLIALLLSGFAAAIAAPIILDSDDEEGDALEIDPEFEDSDIPTLAGLAGDEDPALGDIYDITASVGQFEVEAFDAEEDTFILRTDSLDSLIETGWEQDGTPYLRAALPEGDMHINFKGLTEVPTDAVTFVVPFGDGSEPISLTLTDVLEFGDASEADGDVATYLLDGGRSDEDSVFDLPLDDLAELSPVAVVGDSLVEDVSGLLDDLIPLAPGEGDVIDELTEPVDDLLPVGPGDPDDADVLPEVLPDVTPVAPTPGDALEDLAELLEDAVPLGPTTGDAIDELTDSLDDRLPVGPGEPEADDALPLPLPDAIPIAPTPGDLDEDPHPLHSMDGDEETGLTEPEVLR